MASTAFKSPSSSGPERSVRTEPCSLHSHLSTRRNHGVACENCSLDGRRAPPTRQQLSVNVDCAERGGSRMLTVDHVIRRRNDDDARAEARWSRRSRRP
jgi:hypothetical protein